MPQYQILIDSPCKIMVVGSPGSGKTTLTQQLAQAGGMTAIHLDDLYWKENWKEPNSVCWEKQITQLTAGEGWLIDGNYSSTLPVRINRADIIILLDTPIIICVYRLISRAVRIMTGKIEHLPIRIQKQVLEGEKVSSISGFVDFFKLLQTAISFRKQHRRIIQLISKSSHSPTLITVTWHVNRSVDISKILTKIHNFRGIQNTVKSDKLLADDGN